MAALNLRADETNVIASHSRVVPVDNAAEAQ
jgi:hypothetical protein